MNPIPSARLKKARINLLMDEPFFGSLMMQLRPVEDKTVPTFRTNGDKLWYNPDYMATLNEGQLRTLLAHEVMHPALLHPFRVGSRDLRTANIAADYAINGILDDYNKAAKTVNI
jgi:predicted metal-dependent peptidase